MRFLRTRIAFTLLLLAALPALAPAQSREPPARIAVDRIPRVYGIAVADSRAMRLDLATPLGLYATGPEGQASRVPAVPGGLTALAVDPGNRKHLLAGGRDRHGASLGVMASTDGGRHWKRLAEPRWDDEAFQLLTVSPADPKTVYGVTDRLVVSTDGGRTWHNGGGLPDGLIHMAASAKDTKTLYAATRHGLKVSRDQGAHWQRVDAPPGIASMVHVTPNGRVYLFVVAVGLLSAREPALKWKTLSNRFLDRVLLRMTVDPDRPQRLYAATLTGAVVLSTDGGRHWGAYLGHQNDTPEIIAKGRKLFNAHCTACHGQQGRGQQTTPGFDPKAAPAILAPPLDDSAHAWHHSDENLVDTILNGSPRPGSPMVAWKGVLSRADAESLVAYIKSLWNFRSIACQGAHHMACMRH